MVPRGPGRPPACPKGRTRHTGGVSSHHLHVALLATKILLAPSFVVGASLIARRFGVRVGGLVGALPVVAGPILLVYALAHGRVFAADAAAGTLLGLVSLTTFVVVYAHLAGRRSWGVSLLAGWGAFVLATGLLSALSLPPAAALAVTGVAVASALLILPPRSRCSASRSRSPCARWESAQTSHSPRPWRCSRRHSCCRWRCARA